MTLDYLLKVAYVVLYLVFGFLFVGPIADIAFIKERSSRPIWREIAGYITFSLAWPISLVVILALMGWTAIRGER